MPIERIGIEQAAKREKAHGEILVDDIDRHNGHVPADDRSIRRCAFCFREVGEGFQYCPYCGKRLRSLGESGRRWYYSTAAVVIALATVGPFALPLVWFNPRYRTAAKVILTILILVLTVVLVYLLVVLYLWLAEQMKDLTAVY